MVQPVPRAVEEVNPLGFRRMARQGEGMVLIVVAVHVGDLDCRFENAGVRCHEVVVPCFQK
jgi:hypothetical protein